MQVNPGELDKKIQIVSYTNTTNANGFNVKSENVYRKCYAKVTRLSGTEIIKNNAQFTEVKVRFLVRYKSGLSTDMDIKYENQYYNIEYINDYGDKHQYQEIICKLKERG